MNPQPETRHHPGAAASSDVTHWPLPGATAAASATPPIPRPRLTTSPPPRRRPVVDGSGGRGGAARPVWACRCCC